jgi:hypothetical protein
MNLSLVPVPVFLPEQTLCSILEIAAQVLISQTDFDLIQEVTTVRACAELIAAAPTAVEFHIALRRATEQMIEAMRRKKQNYNELADRLEEILN